jgi:vacuolar-type H+-ATPase subunit H
MKKTFKILFISLLAILLVIFTAPFIFKGKIKSLVLQEANKSLNATLEVGNIRLSFIRSFPGAYIGLDKIVIIGQQNFEADTLLKIETLAVSVNIMDLLNGSPYKIRKIKIDQADVRLKILADGQANWDIVKDSESEVQGGESGNDIRLLLKSLVIKDSRLVYDDIPNATLAVLDEINHSLSGDLGEKFTVLETKTNVARTFLSYEGITYLRDAAVDWKADLDADLENNMYTFRENTLTLNEFIISFDGTVGLPEKGYDLQLTFTSPENTFKRFLSLFPAVYTKEFATVKSDGKMSFDGFVKGKYIDDQYPAFRINLEVSDGWFQYPDLPAAVNDVNITALIESEGGDLDNTVIDIKKISMNLAGNPVLAALLLKNPISDPYIDTWVNAKLNMSDVQTFYPLEEGEELSGSLTADFKLKGRLSDVESGRYNAFEASGFVQTKGIQYTTSSFTQKLLIESAKLDVTPAYLDLTELRVKSGRSDFSLTGKLENYLAYYLKDETLRGQFNLNSSLIDVNEMLDLPDSPDAAIADTSVISSFIVPAGIEITLNASAAAVKYKTFDIANFTGKVRIKDQKLYFDDISMYGLGGRLQMNGSYASADALHPQIDFNLGLKDISVQETFRHFTVVEKFAPIAEKVTGDFSGNFKLAGLLDGQMMPRLETMTGMGDLLTSILKIVNVNTLDQLASSLKMDQLKNLEIAATKFNVQFLDGVMDVKPFDFKALGMDMNLGGQTSLDQRIAYVMNMKIPRSMMGGAANNVLDDLVAKAGQAGANVKLGEYINVAALIGGTISDPKVSLDLAGTGKDIMQSLKDQVQQQVEEKVEEVIDQVKEEAGKYLEEANLQAQAIIDAAQKQSEEVLKAAQNLADETKKQAKANADNVIKESQGKGYLTELAGKKSADELIKQGDNQAQAIMDEAAKTSASIMDKARLEADKIVEEARKKMNP